LPMGARPFWSAPISSAFSCRFIVGHKGWIGMRLDNKVDWQEVAEIVKRSYRMTASKKAG
jgi:hypothetical protein